MTRTNSLSRSDSRFCAAFHRDHARRIWEWQATRLALIRRPAGAALIGATAVHAQLQAWQKVLRAEPTVEGSEHGDAPSPMARQAQPAAVR